MTEPTLNLEQQVAVEAVLAFLQPGNTEKFFILKGHAGTGKTFSLDAARRQIKGRLIFTAPTNKAVKVLRDTLTREDYKPECRTIYSLLGLRMEANGEVKELVAPEDPVDLSKYAAIVIDEASMVNAKLFEFIRKASDDWNVKVIFMGDELQLPPVGEPSSKVWAVGNLAELLTVMRYDNQILKLATSIRGWIKHPCPKITLASDNEGGEGVWRCSAGDFHHRMQLYAKSGVFSQIGAVKAIAWRNATVDSLNAMIRASIFDNPEQRFLPGDRVIVTEPAHDLDDKLSAVTDDEGTIDKVDVEYHALHHHIKIYRLLVMMDDNRLVTLRVLHEDSDAAYARDLNELVRAAQSNRRLWGKFWEFKGAFHYVKHSYAITAHRAQGSTYDSVFVDFNDILRNRNRTEALRCLYVACTRPRKELYLG